MIIAAVLMQSAAVQPDPKPVITTQQVTKSIDLPDAVAEALQPYLRCKTAGWVGVTVTSAVQALKLADQIGRQCATVRTQSKEAAIKSLKERSRLSDADTDFFVEASLTQIDGFADGTKDWCGQQ